MALILKWQWHFFSCSEEPWVRLMKILYGRNGGFFPANRPTVGGSPWLRILAAVHKLHRVNVVPKSTMRRKIGNGEDTCSWEDCWLGDTPLANRFPRLFALEGDSRCRVADKWNGRGWTWQWQRQLEGGRTYAEFQAMLELLENVRCSQDRDFWVWNINLDGVFTVAETRRWIDDLVLPVGHLKTRWCALVPRKVNIFIWRLLLDRIPTRERLSGRGFEIDSIMCPVCGMAPGQLVHLFSRYMQKFGNFLNRAKVQNDTWHILSRQISVLEPPIKITPHSNPNAPPPPSRRKRAFLDSHNPNTRLSP
ncbi:hypothetical protein LXL04_017395 [Taraxacum kok-saghyz]